MCNIRLFFFFKAEGGIRFLTVTGVQTCALPIYNRELFRRDCHMCAYCGGEFKYFRLTRDHITPLSRGGRDTWLNAVAACRHRHRPKRNRRPQACRPALLPAPYLPPEAA